MGPDHIGILVILLLIALIVFGGSRLGGIGGALGKSIREFKREVHTDGGDSDTTSAS